MLNYFNFIEILCIMPMRNFSLHNIFVMFSKTTEIILYKLGFRYHVEYVFSWVSRGVKIINISLAIKHILNIENVCTSKYQLVIRTQVCFVEMEKCLEENLLPNDRPKDI